MAFAATIFLELGMGVGRGGIGGRGPPWIFILY